MMVSGTSASVPGQNNIWGRKPPGTYITTSREGAPLIACAWALPPNRPARSRRPTCVAPSAHFSRVLRSKGMGLELRGSVRQPKRVANQRRADRGPGGARALRLVGEVGVVEQLVDVALRGH